MDYFLPGLSPSTTFKSRNTEVQMDAKPKNKLIVFGDATTISEKTAGEIQSEGYGIIYAVAPGKGKFPLPPLSHVDAILVDGDQIEGEMPFLPCIFKKPIGERPLLIFTAAFRFAVIARALEAGFDEFLAKPIGKEELITLLRKQIPREKRNQQKS